MQANYLIVYLISTCAWAHIYPHTPFQKYTESNGSYMECTGQKTTTKIKKASLYSPHRVPSQCPQENYAVGECYGNWDEPASSQKQHSHHRTQSQALPVHVVAAHQSWVGGSGCRMNIFILVFSIPAMNTQLSNPLPADKVDFLLKTETDT